MSTLKLYHMPLIKSTKRKKGKKTTCFKFGETGKQYCGSGARSKAAKQGRAIERSKAMRGKK